jgi:hypothetical protein
MSLKGVFDLFGFHKDDEGSKISKDLEDFKESPHFKLGMFRKLITQGNVFKKQIISFFEKSDDVFDTDGINLAGEYMVYVRAYFWIQDCKIKSKFWNEALKVNADLDFLLTLDLSIKYFESVEEFEKCAHLKKIYDFVKKNLEK